MPEASATPPAAPAPDHAKKTIAIAAATMGHDLVAALLNEIRGMPDHWSRMNKELQQQTLDRLKDKVAAAVLKAQHMLTTGSFQAVPAVLEYIGRKGGITGKISVRKDELCRHALFDAQGSKVLVVITDPNQWLQRMDELKVHGNQADLFDSDANYDPAKDQPGYRRDQDQHAPAGPTWAELMADLKGKDGTTLPKGETKKPDPETPAPEGGTTPPAGETKPQDGETAPPAPPGDDKTVDEHRVTLEMLREQLGELGVVLSLGALQKRTDADILAATLWVEATKKLGPAETEKSRPAWFPEIKRGKK
jgi:hypothetical protein